MIIRNLLNNYFLEQNMSVVCLGSTKKITASLHLVKLITSSINLHYDSLRSEYAMRVSQLVRQPHLQLLLLFVLRSTCLGHLLLPRCLFRF